MSFSRIIFLILLNVCFNDVSEACLPNVFRSAIPRFFSSSASKIKIKDSTVYIKNNPNPYFLSTLSFTLGFTIKSLFGNDESEIQNPFTGLLEETAKLINENPYAKEILLAPNN